MSAESTHPSGNEAAGDRTSHHLPRMLLWKHRKRSTAGSCGLAEKGVACQRATEKGSTDDQRVPGTV